MKRFTDYAELDLSKSTYVAVTTNALVFKAGWKAGSAQAALVERSNGNVLYFSEGTSNDFYARVMLAAATEFGNVVSVTIPMSLRDEIHLPEPSDWYWMTRFTPIEPVLNEPRLEVIEDHRADNLIHAFIVRSGFSAHMMPGHPEVEFWCVLWDENQELPIAVAAGSKRLSGERVVNTVLVDPAKRGAGLGELITRACAAEIFRRGNAVAHLGVRASNTSAYQLYERLGFVEVEAMSSSDL